MKRFTSETQKVGGLGEVVACKYLVKQGFSIMERNYTKKIGEIDIVCRKDGILHFVEVKTIVSRETSKNDGIYNPFENITRHKLRKFSRTIEWYLLERHVSRETRWQIDAVAVVLNYNTRTANVNILWNVIA